MANNFLKVTLHNLYREKLYTLINIFGLSLAIASCVILGLYLRMELTYDQHNINHKRIFRVALDKREGLGLERKAQIPESFVPQLVNYSPYMNGLKNIKANSVDYSSGNLRVDVAGLNGSYKTKAMILHFH